MPTHEELARFVREYARLSSVEREEFKTAVRLFVEGLPSGNFHPSLRVKRVRGYPGVWEMTWAPDGRATFQYGPEVQPGAPHVVWRRIGKHAIFRRP